MKTDLDITDLFCGAGGSGLGAHAAGFTVRMAANHWEKAIETHSANFPDTEHDLADISQVDPRRYPATTVLWASPECTNHSPARGVSRSRDADQQPDANGEILSRDAAERSRATMWDVPRFAEAMLRRGRPYRAIIVENVVEAARWPLFPAWLQAMTLLGYEHEMVSLNSMHAQAIDAPRAPQSRDRLYIVFWRKGQRRPDVTPKPLAHCERCAVDVNAIQAWKNGNTFGKYRAQYIYLCPRCESTVEPYALPAASAIDWGMPGKRIGDRAKPLSPKTMARIEAGLRKYSREPFISTQRGWGVPGADNRYTRAVTESMSTVIAGAVHQALVVPLEGRDGKVAKPVTEPMRTMTCRHEDALVVPYYGTRAAASKVDEPIGTMTTKDRYALVVPAGGTWNDEASSADEPFRTRTTRETDGVAFVATLRGYSQSDGLYLDSTEKPLTTVAAGGNHHMLVRHNGSRGPGGEMCTPATEPARTITTHGHQSLVSIEQQVEDATFRMLEPHEIQAAMAFRHDYTVLGTRRERVRQLGNGVTPPAAEFLLRAVAASLDAA